MGRLICYLWLPIELELCSGTDWWHAFIFHVVSCN
jgi:hypothetical protein